MSLTTHKLPALMLVGVSLAALAAAPRPGAPPQENPNQPAVGQPVQPVQPGQLQTGQTTVARTEGRLDARNPDRFIAQRLIRSNKSEIAMAKFAEKHATSKEVKAFAEQMVKDHTEFLNKLEQFAGTSPRTEGTAAPTAGVERREERRDERREARAERTEAIADNAQAHQNFVLQIEGEIGDRIQNTMQKEFEHQGRFDMGYMHEQVFAHLAMADILAVFKNHASPELQKLIAQGEQTTQEHLKMARQIVKDLGNERTQSTSTNRND